MKINIHELKKTPEVTFNGVQPITLRGVNPLHSEEHCEAIVGGTVTKVGNRYLVKGDAKAIVKLVCDRCLDEFDAEINAEICQRFSQDQNEEDEEIYLFTGHEIDLEDVVTEAIVLSIPMKWLHHEDCKGICKVCGVNLNKQSCHCDTEEVDPRLEGLMNIFHPQSEE